MAMVVRVEPAYNGKIAVQSNNSLNGTVLSNSLTQEVLLAIYQNQPELRGFLFTEYTTVGGSYAPSDIDPALIHAYDSSELTHNPAAVYPANTLGKAVNDNKALADAFIGGTLRPVTRSSFFLDFANTRFLDPKIPFSRNSVATYIDKYGVMRLAQANRPRFTHDPITKESLGILMESQKTNLLLKSNDFSNANWGKARCSIANGTTKGVYSATAQKMVCDGSNDPMISQIVTVAAVGYTFTFSVYLWTDEALPTKATLRLSGSPVEQLVTKIVEVTNVPQRFEITQTFIAGFVSPTVVARVDPFEGEVDAPVAGRAMYIDCAQLEVSNGQSSSFIPTDTTQVTRQADFITMTGTTFTELFPSVLEGTVLISGIKSAPNNQYSSYWGFFGDNTAGGANAIRLTNSNVAESFGISVYNDGAVVGTAGYNISSGAEFTNAFSWKKGFGKGFNNSTASADMNIGTIPNNINRFNIDGVNGTIKHICFWPVKMDSAYLQAMAKNTVAGKKSGQLPSVGDLAAGAFMSPYGILRTTGRQEFSVDGTGASITRNIRRPYDFSFEVVDNAGVTTMTATPATGCVANTDNSLTFTAPAGKTLTYAITPIYEY